MNPMLNIAIHAIRQAGSFIIKQYEIFNNRNNTKTIEHRNNLLLKIQEKTSRLISNVIKKYHPSHSIITQNTYDNHNKINHETQWIINPLDGQTNFIKNFPYFTSSITIKIRGHTTISVVYDPIHNDLFSAIKGEGTQLNGYRIHHRHITKKIVYEKLIITCFPFCKQNIIMDLLSHNKHQIKKSVNFRYSGSITLDLAYVAAGRIDALFATNLKTHKIDCGTLLIKEAGGLISHLKKNNQNDHTIYKNIIAGNPKLMKFFVEAPYTIKKMIKII